MTQYSWWLGAATLLLLLLVQPIWCIKPGLQNLNYREKEKTILDELFREDRYDKRIRPSGINGTVDEPTIVTINTLFSSIQSIDDVKMEYSIQIVLREQWVDERLVFNDMDGAGGIRYLTLTETNKLWMPNLIFKNEKTGHFHDILQPNMYLRIFPDGGVLYSTRISLTLSCPMNLKLYPFDHQTCDLTLVSYGWTTEDLVFLWPEWDSIQVTKNLHLARFTLKKFSTDYCNFKTNTGTYSCLKVKLVFQREVSHYLVSIYIPCCLLIIVSWVSFWLHQDAVAARVALVVTTLLIMANLTSGIYQSVPPVAYTMAIDVWTSVCLTFVFSSLLQFALVNSVSRSDMHREQKKKQGSPAALEAALEADHLDVDGTKTFAMQDLPPATASKPDSHSLGREGQGGGLTRFPRRCYSSWLAKFPSRSEKIDVISRIIFPLVFTLFNIMYWNTYFFREEEDTTTGTHTYYRG